MFVDLSESCLCILYTVHAIPLVRETSSSSPPSLSSCLFFFLDTGHSLHVWEYILAIYGVLLAKKVVCIFVTNGSCVRIGHKWTVDVLSQLARELGGSQTNLQ